MLKWLLGAVLTLIGLAALLAAGAYFALKRPDIAYPTLAARYESAASRYVDLPGGVRMHYRDQGNRAGPTLVLVHGFSASLITWEPWIERLGGAYRIVTLDLPGHGLTQAGAGYQASIEAFRDIVREFAHAQGLEHFTLIGNSMGGNVAWEYALAYPEAIDALVLTDASGWRETRAGLAEEPPFFKLLRHPVTGPLLRDLDNARLMRQGLEASFADPKLVDEAMLRRYVELARAPGHRDILLQLTLAYRTRNYATPERLAPLTGKPVLIMSGTEDRLVPPEHARQFHDAIPGSQLVMFEAVGHIPQEEAPEQSAQALLAFLERVYARPARAAAAGR